MRSILVAGIAATMLTFAGSTAMAADISAPAADWTGFYIGLGAGYGSFSSDASLVGNTEYLGPVNTDVSGSSSSILGAAFLGYDVQASSNFVIGAELLGSIGTASRNSGFFEASTFGSIVPSVRAGFLVSDDLLFYGRAGYAFTNARVSIMDNGVDQLTDQGSGVGTSKTGWISGPQVGIGTEFRLSQNLHLGFEGDYTWYNTLDVTGTDPNNAASIVTAKTTPREISGLVRLSYHF